MKAIKTKSRRKQMALAPLVEMQLNVQRQREKKLIKK